MIFLYLLLGKILSFRNVFNFIMKGSSFCCNLSNFIVWDFSWAILNVSTVLCTACTHKFLIAVKREPLLGTDFFFGLLAVTRLFSHDSAKSGLLFWSVTHALSLSLQSTPAFSMTSNFSSCLHFFLSSHALSTLALSVPSKVSLVLQFLQVTHALSSHALSTFAFSLTFSLP